MSSVQLCLRDVEYVNKSDVYDCPLGEGSSFPVTFVLLSQLLSGTGTMFFLSSGGPYVEDIVMPNQLPILFGIISKHHFLYEKLVITKILWACLDN